MASTSASSSTPRSNQLQPTIRKINDALYELYKPATSFAKIEIIFFHGLQAQDHREAYLKTWMLADGSECWLNTWLAQEFPQARILSVTYDSSTQVSASTGRMDMHIVGENLAHSLIGLEGIGQSCPVVLVGHCIGGLVLKQVCLQAEQMDMDMGSGINPYKTFLGNMKRGFFYSTPNSGSRAMLTSKQRGPLLQYQELLSKDAARLIPGLQNYISRFFNWQSHYSEVEEGSARYDMDDFSVLSGEDNFSICKPRYRCSSNYQCLVKFVQEVLQIEEGLELQWRSTLRMPPKVLDMFMSGRVKMVIQMLQSSPRLALVGVGGIGKTTLGKAVLIKIRDNFDFSCFVCDVKRKLKSQSENLHDLIAENLFVRTGRRVYPQGRSAESLWSHLLGKKVLLIMDDVDSEDQIRPLLSSNWLGKGSRVIITSRIRSQARMPTFDICEVPLLSEEESQVLFLTHLYADVRKIVPKDLIREVVQRCEGLPLTLEVIGSYLRFEKDVGVWKSALLKLREAESVDGSADIDDPLWARLQVSFDGLAKLEQKMFLDIAVFDEHLDLETWRAAWDTGVATDGSSVDSGLRNLIDRSLITLEIDYQRSVTASSITMFFQIHEQLRDLGKRISRSYDKKELCRASWRQEDVIDLLNNYKGGEARTEIVSASFHRKKAPLAFPESYVWSSIARLHELRLLRLSNVNLSGSESPRFPFKLRFLHLRSCVEDHDRFPFSSGDCWPIREQDVEEGLQQLSVLILDKTSPVRFPCNFHKLSNLKVLIVRGTRLKDLPKEFGLLPALRTLILEDVGLSQLTSSFSQLSSLRTLTLEGCPLTAINMEIARWGEKAPRPLYALTKLRLVDLHELTELPGTFGLLGSLECLSIVRCSALKELPEGFAKLSHLLRLEMRTCDGLESLSESFGNLASLRALWIEGCPRLGRLPDSLGHLPSLDSLVLDGGSFKKYRNVEVYKARRVCSTTGLGLDIFISQYAKQREVSENAEVSTTEPEVSAKSFTHGLQYLQRLPESLGELKSLKRLDIRRCEGLESLPDSLGLLSTLQELRLIDCVKLRRLPESLGQLKSLRELDLDGCSSLESLPASLAELKTLRSLEIGGCDRLERLPNPLRQLQGLRHLALGPNVDHKMLARSLCQLKALQTLKLSLQSLPTRVRPEDYIHFLKPFTMANVHFGLQSDSIWRETDEDGNSIDETRQTWRPSGGRIYIEPNGGRYEWVEKPLKFYSDEVLHPRFSFRDKVGDLNPKPLDRGPDRALRTTVSASVHWGYSLCVLGVITE